MGDSDSGISIDCHALSKLMCRNVLHYALAYLKHWLLKEDRYSQQSPFIFSVYQGALNCIKKETPSTKEEKVAVLMAYFCQLTAANQVLELGLGNKTCSEYLHQITKGKVIHLPTTELFVQGFEGISPSFPELLTFDFVLIHPQVNPFDLQLVLSYILPRMNPKGIIFLEGIHQKKVVNASWKKIQADSQIQLTLDFFDFGVAFISYSGPKTNLNLSY